MDADSVNSQGTIARQRSLARVAAYLRAAGMKEDRACLAAAERITEEAAAEVSLDRLHFAAVDRAADLFEQWICDLSRQLGDGRPMQGPLAWIMRQYLADHPSAFLAAKIPQEVEGRAAGIAIVPPEQPLAMEPQVLGEKPPIFRRGFWKGFAGAVKPQLARIYRILMGG